MVIDYSSISTFNVDVTNFTDAMKKIFAIESNETLETQSNELF